MPDFDARIVTSYRDVPGLALDLVPGQEVDAGDGKAARWRNRAPRRRLTGRLTFGDAEQINFPSSRPEIDGGGGVIFAGNHYMDIPVLDTGDDMDLSDHTVALDIPAVVSSPGGQNLIDSWAPSGLQLLQDDGTGKFGYGGAVAAGALPAGLHVITSSSALAAVDWRSDNVQILTGPVNPTTASPIHYTIGARGDGAGYAYCTMRSVRMWDRALCAREIDLVYRTLSASPFNVANYADVTRTRWRDDTGDGITQLSRLNAKSSAAHYYLKAVATLPALVQITCMVSGEVLPDSQLGGRTFEAVYAIEKPVGASEPLVASDAGYSAVQDVMVTHEGHYTFIVRRTDGGAKILHVDVEAA